MLQIVSVVVIISVFLIASYKDYKTRMVPFETWYPLIIINTPISIYLIAQYAYITHDYVSILYHIVPALWITGSLYYVGYMRIMGGADIWALIFVYLFAIIPRGYTYIDFLFIMVQMSIMGLVYIGLLYIKTRKWEKIPYIPAITAAVIYFFAFGTPL